MDRTVPNTGNEKIALYIRTYYSLLRSSREVNIKTLVEAHTRMESALHVAAESARPDLSAFIYAVLRLPTCILSDTQRVIMGQSQRVFAEHGYPEVEKWLPVSALARRRRCFFDGQGTLAVYIASRSDIDDLIPILTAYQIERDKLYGYLRRPDVLALLRAERDPSLSYDTLTRLAVLTGLPAEDWGRLCSIWGEETLVNLRRMGERSVSLTVRLLSGSLADYRRATRQWWQHVDHKLSTLLFEERPIYFVSSNTHSLANLVSGYAQSVEKELTAYVTQRGSAELQAEYAAIQEQSVPSSWENFLYYVLKKVERDNPALAAERAAQEAAAGVYRVPSEHVFDVELQVLALHQFQPARLDSRLQQAGLERLRHSRALIINIDFPLGMGAYQLLSEIARNIASLRGVYIIGKAATLNGRIGDVMLPAVVHDEHSDNTYLFRNCIAGDDVAPYLAYGNVLDNQKAITVLGTFLQNREHMSVFYHEGYTDMEMEAGPYLNAIYEMVRPQRYPQNEIVDLHSCAFPVGLVHYASDTPFSKGKNLGAQNLSYFGMDATYAASLATLNAIIREELRHLP